jgi:hypothetical protein
MYKFVLMVVAAAMAALLLLPTIISLPQVREKAVALISEQIPGQIAIGNWQVGWLSGVVIEGVILSEKEGDEQISIKRVEAPISWLAALRYGKIEGEMRIKGLSVAIPKDELLAIALERTIGTAAAHVKLPPLKSLQLRNVDGELIPHPGNRLAITASGESLYGSHRGHFAINAEVLTHNPGNQLLSSVVRANVELNDFPLHSVDNVIAARTFQLLGGLIGTQLNGQLHAEQQLGGHRIGVSCHGEHGTVSFEGDIKANTLYLHSPLLLHTTASNSLNELFPREFAVVLEKQQPISLTIDAEGFKCPLSPLQLATVEIGRGSLTAGKLQAHNQGVLRKVSNFLSLPVSEQLSIWITPLYFQLNRGVVQLARVDMLLADAVHLVSWGTVDLASQRLDLRLAAPGSRLASSLGLKGLTSDELIVLPLVGSISRPHLDSSKLVMAVGSAVVRFSGKLEGALVGSVLDRLGEPLPPPTTDPLPWVSAVQKARVDKGESVAEFPLEPAAILKKQVPKLLKKLFK